MDDAALDLHRQARETAIENRRARCYKQGHTVTNAAGRVRQGTAYTYAPTAR